MKKIISAITAGAVIFSSVAAFKISESSAEAANGMIKIMCIGDSITDGYVSQYIGSYRKYIYRNLSQDGYTIDMVGAKDGDWNYVYIDTDTDVMFEFDNGNTAYSGYSIMEYSGRSGIYEVLRSTDCLSAAPDIVTLQIGTNDVIDNYEIDTAGERLGVLVDYILENIPDDSALFVTTIPDVDPNRSDVYSWFGNYRHSADWQVQYTDEQAEQFVAEAVSSYNSQVKQVVDDRKSQGAKIYFADVNSVVTDVKTQLFDGVHPNDAGYKAMGDYWTGVIKAYLKDSSGNSAPPFGQPDDGKFTVSDLVKMSRYLLGYTTGITYTEEELVRYDLDKSGVVDVYDVILGRKAILDIAVKYREKFGENACIFENGTDKVIIYPYEETTEPATKLSVSVKIEEVLD